MLAVPFGPDPVKAYRFPQQIECDRWDSYEDDEWPSRLACHIEDNGADALWTNNWTDEMHAFVDALGLPLVAEVDDLFTDIERGNMAHMSWRGKRKKLYIDLLKRADRVVCSTPLLAEKFGGQLAQNFVNPGEWIAPEVRQRRDGECVILCPAASTRAGDYLAKEGPFRRALELPHVKMVFMGSVPEWAAPYPAGKVVLIRWVPWEKYKGIMAWLNPDIVVSPLEHNQFNVAKSNLKWLEAAMCGAAFVGERWGEYARTVNDGITGVLADGEAEWTDALLGLALNAETRQHVAEAGRAEVLKSWTWDAVAPQWRKAVLGEA